MEEDYTENSIRKHICKIELKSYVEFVKCKKMHLKVWMLVALRDLTPASYRKVRDLLFVPAAVNAVGSKEKKQTKRTKDSPRLHWGKRKKEAKLWGEIKLDRTGSAARSEQNLLLRIRLLYNSLVIWSCQANFGYLSERLAAKNCWRPAKKSSDISRTNPVCPWRFTF
jgi:hypothetical protein